MFLLQYFAQATHTRTLQIALVLTPLFLFGCSSSSSDVPVSTVQITELSVDLRDYVQNTLSYVQKNTNGYIKPLPADLTTFDETIAALISQQFSVAQTKAGQIGFQLVKIIDTGLGSNGDLFCLREMILQGQGFFCVNYMATKALHIAIPHPLYDSNTNHGGVVIMRGTDAKYFSLSTTHRCANGANSMCSGTTTACGASGPFKESDMAHNADSYFHRFAIAINASDNTLTTIQSHGCGSSSCPANGDSFDIVARVSVGTTTNLNNTEQVNVFKDELNTTLALLTGASAKSCSDAAEADKKLCATTNTQGRYVNGETADPCQTTASVFTNSRFLHVEQNADLRADDGGADTITPDILIDAINNVY